MLVGTCLHLIMAPKNAVKIVQKAVSTQVAKQTKQVDKQTKKVIKQTKQQTKRAKQGTKNTKQEANETKEMPKNVNSEAAQTPPLTKANLAEMNGASGGTMTKAEKIALLNDKVERDRRGEPVEYTYDDTRCLYGRFQTALRAPQEGSSKAREELAKIEQEGKGKEAKKRAMLRAWYAA